MSYFAAGNAGASNSAATSSVVHAPYSYQPYAETGSQGFSQPVYSQTTQPQQQSYTQQPYVNQAHLYQPQIAPWAPYMRSQNGAGNTPSLVPSVTVGAKTSPPPSMHSSHTKRHNPYAAGASDSGSAVTSPALGYTAATNAPSFERMPPASSNYTAASHAPQQQSTAHRNEQTSRSERSQGDRSQGNRQITSEEVRQQLGGLLDLAHTANGSAFLQAAIRGSQPDTQTSIELISGELLPHLGDLLLDSHGCYIIKTLMERMPAEQLLKVMQNQIAPDESLVYSLCTHSLHTRRVVQFLLDTIDCAFLIDTITCRCSEIATTQQGCIVVQRAMDVSVGPQRQRLFSAIQGNFNTFCYDPFANYVLQHMFAVGDAGEVGRGVWPHIKGNVVNLSCNKFASNVVEKCLSNLPVELQHDLLHEMYDVPEERLLAMLQDSFGNYIIQTSIALAPQKDIPFMRTKLMAVLDRTPYGHKIESRLERRKKVSKGDAPQASAGGNGPATTLTGPPSVGTTNYGRGNVHKGHSERGGHHQHHHAHRGRGGQRAPIAPVAPVAEGEEPW